MQTAFRNFTGTFFLEVRESNEARSKFYKYLGFQEVSVRPEYYDIPPGIGYCHEVSFMLRWRIDGMTVVNKSTEITHRAFLTNRLGAATSPGGIAHMERIAQEELKAHLMATNEEFRQLANQHSEYRPQAGRVGSAAPSD